MNSASWSRKRYGFGLAVAAAALLARPAAADDAPCREPSVAVADESAFPAEAAPVRLFTRLLPEPSVEKVRTGGKKRFLAAAGELILLEAGPWAFDRYVSREDFAFISTRTVRNNFRTGFHYDRDTFPVNQSSHPYHGSLFFDAARSNGYGFWESGAFAMTGSLIWECCMENTAPSINDLVNTTFGGMTRGEVAHRMSAMVLDNTSTGASRIFREIGAAILNPVGSLNRLLRGEVGRDFENPPDRFPSVVVLSADLGYRHIGGGAARADQATLSLSLLYGNPFEGDLSRPFDSFWLGIDLNAPGGVLASRIEERGILKGWELTDRGDKVRHIFGFTQEYEYLNNESQVFGAQMFGAGLLSRYSLGKNLVGLTDASVIVIPLAGIKTTDFENPETGRNYDYAPGGGARVSARAYLGGREVLAAGYGVAWARTVNGVSKNNTLQFFRALARFPLAGPVGAGAAYYWYSRQTTYPGFFEPRKTQSEWRAFINAVFPFPFR
jgi:hypothetical protein